MKIAIYSSKSYDKEYLSLFNKDFNHDLHFIESRLEASTVSLSSGYKVICAFANDVIDQEVIELLSKQKVELIALRCAGYDNADLESAKQHGIKVIRVSNYSPNAVAEHALSLMFALNRHVCQSYEQVKNNNFSIDNLLGFDFAGKTMGIIGVGKIGSVVAKTTKAMGMRVVAYDTNTNPELNIEYVDLDYLFKNSDVISLHCPLNKCTKHIINSKAISIMKNNVMLINTSRGAAIDTCAIVDALKAKEIGYLGIDVYENEKEVFFEDLSCEKFSDKMLEELTSFPNVLISPHQGFFTKDAINNIANTTLKNIKHFENKEGIPIEDLLV